MSKKFRSPGSIVRLKWEFLPSSLPTLAAGTGGFCAASG
jgi:hypothetical protein